MSADNWTICPQCEQTRTDPVTEAKKLYGQIPLEEFETAMKTAKHTQIDDDTLREDYEFYLEAFQLNIVYGCSCSKCTFEFEYKTQVDMPH